VGYKALYSINGVTNNTAIGSYALQHNTAPNNTATGSAGLYQNTSGADNTANGFEALWTNEVGNGNTATGSEALKLNTGSNNTANGWNALTSNVAGANNTALGAGADVSAAGLTNSTVIGANAKVGANNTIQLGDDGFITNTPIEHVRTSGALTTGVVTYPNTAPSTNGQLLTANTDGSTSWTGIRDLTDEFTATAAQTTFTLSQAPSANSKVKMYINGIRISNSAYSVVGTTLTYNPTNNGSYALSESDRIQMDYFY
jgi:hypothetical protein